MPYKQVNSYAKTKLLAENEIDLAYKKGLPVITIRPRGLFGPGDTAIIPRLIKAHESIPLPLFKNGVKEKNGSLILVDLSALKLDVYYNEEFLVLV